MNRLPVLDRRRSGVLLHMSSLEAALGRGGRAFIDWLVEARFSVWQLLPLGPTGHDGSPYWVRSDYAGNASFLDQQELPQCTPEGEGHDATRYAQFLEDSRDWLEDYARFEVLSALHKSAPWWTWPAEHRDRDPDALARLAREHTSHLQRIRFEQFAFAWQWQRLRDYAHERGVRFFGDVPFYVAPDSAETWANRQQFQLDETGEPRAVAGVPPDYFSELGQLWGNPLYDWDEMRKDGFSFWRTRFRQQLQRVDVLRIDHFRALAAHWAVPAGAPDARGGQWVQTPGHDVLSVLREEFCDLPVVAEDLGLITEDVARLRKEFQLPGMRVLQFAFNGGGGGDNRNVHLPFNHEHDCVVYTGTHDNDTTLGWYQSLNEDVRTHVDDLLGASTPMPEALIRAALISVGKLAVIPMQDLLGLGTEARMNTPGTTQDNWNWRLPAAVLTSQLARHYARLNRVLGRCD